MFFNIFTKFCVLQYIESMWPSLCNGESRLVEYMMIFLVPAVHKEYIWSGL
jgi:hypothetical protein